MVTGVTLWETLVRLQTIFRAAADEFAAAAANATNDFERFGNNLLEWLCRALAGLVMGVAAGYASHLLLDMGSKRGLPLFA